jgi:mTERF domain-containing protein
LKLHRASSGTKGLNSQPIDETLFQLIGFDCSKTIKGLTESLRTDNDTNTLKRNLKFMVDELGMDPQLKRIMSSENMMMIKDFTLFWSPNIFFLVEECGVDRGKLGKVIASFPQILGLSIEDNLKPTVAFLVEECGLDRGKLGKAVSSSPSILAYSIEENLKPTVEYLVQECGMDRGKLGKVLA